jgi:O-antigen/teichoic acid export membrane protein
VGSLLRSACRLLREVTDPAAYRAIARQVKYPVGASIISQTALGFGLAAALSRLLGARSFGQYAVVMTIAGIFQLIAAFPVETGVARFLAEARQGRPSEVRALYSAGLVARLAASLVALSAALLLSGWLSTAYHLPGFGREISIAALSVCLLTPLSLFFLSCIQGMERPRRWATGALVSASFVFPLGVWGARAFPEWGHKGLFLLIAAGWAGAAVACALLARGALGFLRPAGARRQLRQMVSFVLPIGIVPIAGFSAHTITKSALAVRWGPVPVGQFEIALTLLAHMGMLYGACMIVLLPAWARLYARRAGAELLVSMSHARGALIGVALVYGAALALGGQWLVPAVFGPEQSGAAPAARVMGLVMPVMISGWVASTTNVVSGSTAIIARANVVWFLLVVPIGLSLIPHYGALGAAIAWLCAYLVFSWCYIHWARPFFREVAGWGQSGADEPFGSAQGRRR